MGSEFSSARSRIDAGAGPVELYRLDRLPDSGAADPARIAAR